MTTLTAAQAAQQHNRHTDGRYAEQHLTDPGSSVLSDPPNETGDPLREGSIVWVDRRGYPGWPGKVRNMDGRSGGMLTVATLTGRPLMHVLGREDVTVIDSPGDQVLADNTSSQASQAAARKAELAAQLRTACDQYNHAQLASGLLRHAPADAATVAFTIDNGQAVPTAWCDTDGNSLADAHHADVAVAWQDGTRPGDEGSWQHSFINPGTVGQFIDLDLVRAWAIDHL